MRLYKRGGIPQEQHCPFCPMVSDGPSKLSCVPPAGVRQSRIACHCLDMSVTIWDQTKHSIQNHLLRNNFFLCFFVPFVFWYWPGTALWEKMCSNKNCLHISLDAKSKVLSDVIRLKSIGALISEGLDTSWCRNSHHNGWISPIIGTSMCHSWYNASRLSHSKTYWELQQWLHTNECQHQITNNAAKGPGLCPLQWHQEPLKHTGLPENNSQWLQSFVRQMNTILSTNKQMLILTRGYVCARISSKQESTQREPHQQAKANLAIADNPWSQNVWEDSKAHKIASYMQCDTAVRKPLSPSTAYTLLQTNKASVDTCGIWGMLAFR